jgi:hypothetical protein
MESAGYRNSTPPNAHPYRKRLYFYDPEGNDWESACREAWGAVERSA